MQCCNSRADRVCVPPLAHIDAWKRGVPRVLLFLVSHENSGRVPAAQPGDALRGSGGRGCAARCKAGSARCFSLRASACFFRVEGSRQRLSCTRRVAMIKRVLACFAANESVGDGTWGIRRCFGAHPFALDVREIDISLPNNQRQRRTLHIQKDVLPFAFC